MDLIIINIICYLIFPFIILWKAEYLKSGWNEAVLTKDDSSAMRGISAIFIILAHYLSYVKKHGISSLGPALLMEWCGGLGVCVFFFASGYGLWISYREKDINRSYVYNRFINVIPATITLRIIFSIILGIYKNGWQHFLLYIINLEKPLWFISEIVLIYIMFYIAMKISRKYSIALISAMITAMSLIFYMLGFNARWYNAALVFSVGLLTAKYRSAILEFFKKNYFLKLALLFISFGICAVGFSVFKGNELANLLKLSAGAIFSMCLFCLLMKLRIKSQLLLSIGNASLQAYIIHLGIISTLFLYLGERYMLLQFVCGIIVGIIAAIILRNLELRLRNQFH